jgi:hypothetical protein
MAYKRKQTDTKPADVVQAIQVKRPYRDVSNTFPRTHIRNKPSGALNYIRVIDAPEGKNQAAEGDWIVKFPDGRVEVIPDKEFGQHYS